MGKRLLLKSIQKIMRMKRVGITALVVTSVVLLAQSFGLLQLLECTILDQWFRLRPPENSQPYVVIVTINEEDIANFGSWPISDQILANTIRAIAQQKPRVIGLDLYRNLTVGEGKQDLLDVYASTPNLIGIGKFLNQKYAGVSAPQVLQEKEQVAASDLVIDEDGRIRRHLLSLQDRNQKLQLTLGSKLALEYLQAKGIHIQENQKKHHIKLGKAQFYPLANHTGGYVKKEFGGYQILANFQEFPQGIPKIPITSVLKKQIPRDLFTGKVVLIGSTAESVSNKFYTPYTTNINTAWFGVEIHANLTNQIIAAAIDGRQILKGVPESLEWVWVLFWSIIGSWWGWNICQPKNNYSTLPQTPFTFIWQEYLPQQIIICIFAISFALISCCYLIFLAGWWIILAAPYLACMGAFTINYTYHLRKRLSKYRQRLASYTQSLEIKVRERTQELQEKNFDLEKAKQTAENANLAKSTFLANMSHELRTPLNVILGFTQVISGDSNLNPEQTKHLDTINRAGEHLLSLINNILEISKIESGRIAVERNSFDLLGMFQILKKMFEFKAEAKNLDFILELPENIPQYIQTDEGKLRQILINLLGNAIKFTEQGKIICRVGFERNYGKNGGILKIEVADTGVGIASEDIERIFTAFEQTEIGRKSTDGTGLGLTICHKFIQLIGGKIQVESQIGQGSIFKLEIPIIIDSQHQLNNGQNDKQIIGLAANQPVCKILVADDHPPSRELLVKVFDSVGFQTQQATNGEEAMEIWSNWQPDLICLDIQMPIINGWEVSKRIKSQSTNHSPVIIAVSANAFAEDREQALANGCDDFMSKPFPTVRLLEMVAKHLDLQYIYKDSCHTHTVDLDRLQVKALLLQTPHQWQEKLYNASCLCDDNRIFDLLDELPRSQNQLKAVLTDLAANFRFDRIIELMEMESDSYSNN